MMSVQFLVPAEILRNGSADHKKEIPGNPPLQYRYLQRWAAKIQLRVWKKQDSQMLTMVNEWKKDKEE